MTAKDKERAKRRTELLAGLRKEHRERVRVAQDMLKEQLGIRKTLRRALQGGPYSVPQLAEEVGQPAHEVLWHIAAMKKYGDVVETGLDEDYEYYLYGLAKEVKS